MKIRKLKTENLNRGYSTLELLFYIALFAVIVLVVINAMITMTRSFREANIQAELLQAGDVVERISREVRQASSISSITATTLRLNAEDSAGVSKIVDLVLSGGDIQLSENGVLVGNLNTSNIIVTDLAFTEITTTKGKAVKIILTLRSSKDVLARTESFYNTVVLRGNY